jgi:nucleotide-binding universal stress UspA family protein
MRVLLAYDGSAGAAEAAALTQAIPWPRDSILRVVNVLEPILSPMSGPGDRVSVPSADLDATLTASANETLREVVQRLGSSVRSVDGGVLRGRAASVIVDDAREFRADLVIVGSRGHGAIATLLLGSVSSEVVDHAPCPVLVARGRSLTGVVFATDDSPSGHAAEAILARWPIFAGLPIHVLSVAEVVHPWTTGIAPTIDGQVLDAYAAELGESRAQHQQIATIAATRLRESGRHVDSEMREGDPAEEIIAAAAKRGADLIVLGSRGRTGLTRLLLGSVARNVLSGSNASVLVVHEPTENAQDSKSATR